MNPTALLAISLWWMAGQADPASQRHLSEALTNPHNGWSAQIEAVYSPGRNGPAETARRLFIQQGASSLSLWLVSERSDQDPYREFQRDLSHRWSADGTRVFFESRDGTVRFVEVAEGLLATSTLAQVKGLALDAAEAEAPSLVEHLRLALRSDDRLNAEPALARMALRRARLALEPDVLAALSAGATNRAAAVAEGVHLERLERTAPFAAVFRQAVRRLLIAGLLHDPIQQLLARMTAAEQVEAAALAIVGCGSCREEDLDGFAARLGPRPHLRLVERVQSVWIDPTLPPADADLLLERLLGLRRTRWAASRRSLFTEVWSALPVAKRPRLRDQILRLTERKAAELDSLDPNKGPFFEAIQILNAVLDLNDQVFLPDALAAIRRSLEGAFVKARARSADVDLDLALARVGMSMDDPSVISQIAATVPEAELVNVFFRTGIVAVRAPVDQFVAPPAKTRLENAARQVLEGPGPSGDEASKQPHRLSVLRAVAFVPSHLPRAVETVCEAARAATPKTESSVEALLREYVQVIGPLPKEVVDCVDLLDTKTGLLGHALMDPAPIHWACLSSRLRDHETGLRCGYGLQREGCPPERPAALGLPPESAQFFWDADRQQIDETRRVECQRPIQARTEATTLVNRTQRAALHPGAGFPRGSLVLTALLSS
ncbi:MAG: hypothetical protein HY901_20695, partial [Deltaproteobacteria bacterium]|nr:hypothetical protein [Deltaproteobacteria bacterium]